MWWNFKHGDIIYVEKFQIKVFERFLQLGGYKWAVTVPYEQGIPLRRSGNPTCLYSYQNKFDSKMCQQNWRDRGQIALLGPLRLKCRSNTSMWAHLTSQPAEGLWNGWGSLGSLGSHLCCPGPLWNLKGVFWSFFYVGPRFLSLNAKKRNLCRLCHLEWTVLKLTWSR